MTWAARAGVGKAAGVEAARHASSSGPTADVNRDSLYLRKRNKHMLLENIVFFFREEESKGGAARLKRHSRK